MANRNNSGRAKKTHSFKPYNTSNSFVKRITAKVSEILPQPSSWVSRLFSPASKLNTRAHDEVDDEDDDEEERCPPSKRLCFAPPEPSDFSHQNNVNRLGDLGRGSGEISPILSSRTDEDRAVPGPSGLHLRHFVSSTPALRQPPPSKSNLREKTRDDASDESETTSGCSSLVPGAERPRQEQLSTPTPASPTTLSSMRRLSTNALKANATLNRTSSMNLSTSSQPSFDTHVFNNPLNRSGIRRSLADESCFYPGHTTFGGSSSRLAPIEQPRVVCVKASPSKQIHQDTIGTSALRILRALEQFSTPVLDAKRIPLRKDFGKSERKRKAAQPYEELIYPSMPDLLRLKRREQEEERKKREKKETTSSSTSSHSLPSTSRAPDLPPSEPQYTFRTENPKERRIGSIKGRSKDEDFESERVPPVNLPNVKLQLATLPKLDITVAGAEQKSTMKARSSSVPSSPRFEFSEPEAPPVDGIKPCLLVNTFKFSEPLEAVQVKALGSVSNDKPPPPQLQMKNPSPNLKLKRKTPEISTVTQSNFKFEVKPATEMKNASVMEVLSKKPFGEKSSTENWTCSACNSKTSNGQSKCISCAKATAPSPVEVSPSPPVPLWDCKKCSLKNSSTETKCKSCGVDKNENNLSSTTFKGFEGFKKPKDSWECSSCLVTNKNSLDSCAACSTPKSGKNSNGSKNIFESSKSKPSESKSNDIGANLAVSSSTPLLNSLKKPEGSWECSTCLVRNKKEDTKCVACSTPNPNAPAASEKPKPTFSFGIPPTSSTETKSFNAFSSSGSQPQFTFGMPSENKIPVSSSITGIETKSEGIAAADSSTSVPCSSSIPATGPLVNSIKKPEGSWECSTCLVQNKKESTSCVACNTTKPGAAPAEAPKLPTFSFGIPPPSSSASTNQDKTININSKPQFMFGNVSEDKKTTSLFGFPSNEPKRSNDLKPFTFLGSDQSKEKEVIKAPMTNLFTFGSTNKETKNDDMNDEGDDKPAKKRVSFGNPLTIEKKITNDTNTSSFGSLVHNKTNEISSSSNFAFTPKFTSIENNTSLKKEATPTSNALFSFGNSSASASKANDMVPPTEPSKHLPFGGMNSDKPTSEMPNSNSIFGGNPTLSGFKSVDTENKPFSFMGNAQTGSQQPSGGFSFTPPTSTELSTQPNQVGAGGALFGQQATPPLFSQTQAPEQKPFVFNAPLQQQQQQQQTPLFTFTAPTQGGIGGSSFGSTFAPPAAPKFDPNIKPSFNFTGGATPSFSTNTNSVEVGGSETKRKVRKAIRRTTQQR